jgi:hypothetical protein
MKQATIIKRLQARALAKYNEGWDTFAECYEAADWLAFTTNDDTGEPMTWREALAMAEECASIWRERQAEAASYREEWPAAAADDGKKAGDTYHYSFSDYGPYDHEEDKRDDGDDWSPREPLQFIPHASDYSRFD